MKNYKSIVFVMLWAMSIVGVFAQGFDKASYYASASGKKGEALKSALAGILNSGGFNTVGYDGLLTAYAKTDVRDDGKIWDMYSNATNYSPGSGYSSTYKVEGDGYNREHTIPQSVFGSGTPKSDLFHVYPTDAKINGVRSNYCHGEVGTVKTASKNNFSLLGAPSAALRTNGCREDYVFEPNDMYKGDFARTYFYFMTCYESRISGMDSYGMFTKKSFNCFTDWAVEMLFKWSEQDGVSEKETDRVEAVYNQQHNRNPFIDYPGLEQYIWGDYKNIAFNPNNYVNPYDEDEHDKDDGKEDDDKGDGDDKDKDDDVVFAKTVTYVFNSADWKGEANKDGEWEDTQWESNGHAPFGFASDKGIQVTKSYSGAGATSPDVFKNVCSVVIKYCTNSSNGAGSFDVKVGGETLSSTEHVTNEGGTTLREITYKPSSESVDGAVSVTVNCTTNSLYVNSITVNCSADSTDDINPGVLITSHPVYFDLSGRRVDAASAKRGIYVVNGRKVVK